VALLALGYWGWLPMETVRSLVGWDRFLPQVAPVESQSGETYSQTEYASGSSGLELDPSPGAGSVAAQPVGTELPPIFSSTSPGTGSSDVSQSGFFPSVSEPPTGVTGGGVSPSGPGWPTPQPLDNRSLIMGTFNIQVFGQAKMGNSDVMQIILDVTRRFDLLAIQEFRAVDQELVSQFVEMLNVNGLQYSYCLGPRQGYTSSQEQYIYVYDATKLRLIAEPFVAEDNLMHRAPWVAQFQSIELPPEQAFSFCLLNVHTDPDVVRDELNYLKNIVERVRQAIPEEDDFIVLGDFNAPTSFLDAVGLISNPHFVVQENWVTNTRETRNYDNIAFDSLHTREYMGRAGVFNFQREYQLSLDEALRVSDHYPVWAMFSIFEQHNSTLANQPRNPR
jgi:endonuclease/exonuclease/phosphatase family metal-dependent hydrolase